MMFELKQRLIAGGVLLGLGVIALVIYLVKFRDDEKKPAEKQPEQQDQLKREFEKAKKDLSDAFAAASNDFTPKIASVSALMTGEAYKETNDLISYTLNSYTADTARRIADTHRAACIYLLRKYQKSMVTKENSPGMLMTIGHIYRAYFFFFSALIRKLDFENALTIDSPVVKFCREIGAAKTDFIQTLKRQRNPAVDSVLQEVKELLKIIVNDLKDCSHPFMKHLEADLAAISQDEARS